MLIGNSLFGTPRFEPQFDFGSAMVSASQAAAGPAFELQFFLTQDAILSQLNDEINGINGSINTSSATALIDIQLSRLQSDLVGVNDFKARTATKTTRVTNTLERLADLTTLAAPGTVAEFDETLAEAINIIQKTKSPTYERYGVQDGLRKAKANALAQLESLAHNNFATQTDIDDTTAILAEIQADYLASQSIITSNTNIAFNLQTGADRTIQELNRQVSVIKTDAISGATGKVKEKQEYYGQLLTTMSLAFEASQEFTKFIADSLAVSQEIEPGSVLNLFS